jgi:meso-butanediol dehydrogenase / (S,S)-butanediol dehydrogenase / diacetyl reductase
MGRFDGKVALITGAGTGIGAATARRIAAEGGRVVVTGRRREPIEKVAIETGGLAIAGDTTSPAHVEEVVAATRDHFGGLDILVANAGIELFGSAEEVPLEDWERTLKTNIEGTMLAARMAIPEMRARNGGAMVLVASVAALTGAPLYVSYLTSKAAMLGLSRSLAYDFGPERIRCNAICPGWTRTEMAERAIGEFAAAKEITLDEMIARLVGPYPLRRMADPDEIASVIAFLVSEDASFVTGATIIADGGGSIVDIGTLGFAS